MIELFLSVALATKYEPKPTEFGGHLYIQRAQCGPVSVLAIWPRNCPKTYQVYWMSERIGGY